jgi:hypothetical protein
VEYQWIDVGTAENGWECLTSPETGRGMVHIHGRWTPVIITGCAAVRDKCTVSYCMCCSSGGCTWMGVLVGRELTFWGAGNGEWVSLGETGT